MLAGVSLLLLRLRHNFRKQYATCALTAVLTFQVLIFASDWVTLSPRLSETVLPINNEIEQIKQRVGKERVYLVGAEGKATILFPPNTLAAYDIATLQGYESLWPKTMWYKAGYAVNQDLLSRQAVRFAIVGKRAGSGNGCWQPPDLGEIPVSSGIWDHRLLVTRVTVYGPPGVESPRHSLGRSHGEALTRTVSHCWPLIYSGSSFGVFKNDWATPRYLALTSSGAVPAEVISETFNRRLLRVPPGANSVRVAENWSKGWRYRIGRSDWHHERGYVNAGWVHRTGEDGFRFGRG